MNVFHFGVAVIFPSWVNCPSGEAGVLVLSRFLQRKAMALALATLGDGSGRCSSRIGSAMFRGGCETFSG